MDAREEFDRRITEYKPKILDYLTEHDGWNDHFTVLGAVGFTDSKDIFAVCGAIVQLRQEEKIEERLFRTRDTAHSRNGPKIIYYRITGSERSTID